MNSRQVPLHTVQQTSTSFMIAWQMSQPAATDQGVRSVSSTFHHFPWPKITQTYTIRWGRWLRWEMWVYQGTKPWLISLIASKSSQVISFREWIPSRLQWRCCVKISKQLRVGCSFRHFISSHFVLWDGGSEISMPILNSYGKLALTHSRNPLHL